MKELWKLLQAGLCARQYLGRRTVTIVTGRGPYVLLRAQRSESVLRTATSAIHSIITSIVFFVELFQKTSLYKKRNLRFFVYAIYLKVEHFVVCLCALFRPRYFTGGRRSTCKAFHKMKN